MRELYRYLAAKNDVSESKWLPLWVHCLDTYHTMRYLLQEWKNSGAMYAITKRITEDKMQDLNAFTMDAAMNMVAGTARSMGILVEE